MRIDRVRSRRKRRNEHCLRAWRRPLRPPEGLEERTLMALAASDFNMFSTPDLTVPGLVGSYVNSSLRSYLVQDDWRQSQPISGTRNDGALNFTTNEEGLGGNRFQLLQETAPRLRVAYLIPNNREPQPEAVARLQGLVQTYQDFFRHEMTRFGFDNKIFEYEVHMLDLPEDDAFYRADDQNNDGLTIYNRLTSAASDLGLGILTPGEIWLLMYEGHTQDPNGAVRGGVALGLGAGSGSGGGVGVVDSARLSLLDIVGLRDERQYDGLVIPEIGPFPLRFGVSFPDFEGPTVSSIASSTVGAILHEIGHGLGLLHDFRNDANFDGNLMGNGLRGFRGVLSPQRFPEETTRLTYGAALFLNRSPFFNPFEVFPGETPPLIDSVTVEPQVIQGLVHVSFAASDPDGLAVALLRRNGADVAEIPLSGVSVATAFRTPHYSPGEVNTFTVTVYDVYGVRQDMEVTQAINNTFNQAPVPSIRVLPSTVGVNQSLLLDATRSTDADQDSLLVEWDFDGDGTFDTTPSASLTHSVVYATAGVRQIVARLTDSSGAQSLSSPLGVLVAELPDLVVGRLEIVSRDATQIDYRYTIVNQGRGTAVLTGPTTSDFDNVFLQAFLSADTIVDASDLPAGETILRLLTQDFLISDSFLSGSFSATATIDPATRPYLLLTIAGDLSETDRSNNSRAALINPLLVLSPDSGMAPLVRVLDATDLHERFTFMAYAEAFTAGVRVALGKINDDDVPDIITAPGPGGGPHIRVFSGIDGTELFGFFAYDPSFSGGVYVACADVNGDRRDDIITGAGAGGGPHVRVFSGQDGSELFGFFAYHPSFSGGVRVAAGNLNGDALADIITGAGPGGGPHVKVFDGMSQTEFFGFFAYDPAFSGGVFLAAGNVDGDNRSDIITGAGAGGGPHVRVFRGGSQSELFGFLAYHPSFSGGVRVAAADLDGDGLDDVITAAGPGGGPHVRAISGATATEIAGLFAYEASFAGGVFLTGMPSTIGPDALRLGRDAADNRSKSASPIAADISSPQLQLIHAAAVARWEAAGLPQERIGLLRRANISTADLPGDLVGVARGGNLVLDHDAAGRGWYIDPTPHLDDEFEWPSGFGVEPASSDGVDLLTAVLHELGHLLNLPHCDAVEDLMASSLGAGIRRLPTNALLNAVWGTWSE